MKAVLLAAFCALPLLAGAQSMYKCGNTFSQTPCGADAQQIGKAQEAVPTTPPPDDVVAANIATCERSIRSRMKDPDAAQIKNITRRIPVDVPMSSPPTRGIGYVADVNGKNSYGGYVGFKTYFCIFDLAETKLLYTSN